MTGHRDDSSGAGPPVPEDAAPPALPLWRRTQPLGLWWVFPIGLAVSLYILLDGRLREAGYAMAATLAVAAIARLVLPRGAVGGLLVRSRAWDVLTLLALGAGMVVLSATLVIR